jgi:hypothetical protein
MMIRMLMVIAAAATLAACSDKPQTAGAVKQDAAPFTGTGKPYALQNWKQGDKTAWEQQLKTRTQSGQNDYTKVN